MTRYSLKRDGQIEYSFWLVFAEDGSMSFARGEPTVGRNQRAMRCRALLPISLFRRPEIQAVISIPDPGSSRIEIDATAAAEALKAAIGVDIDLRVVAPAGDDHDD